MMSVLPEERLLFDEEIHRLRVEAILDLFCKSDSRSWHMLLLDLDNSRRIRSISLGTRLALLRQLHTFLLEAMPQDALCYWYGNDEFVIIYDSRDEPALVMAERLLGAVEQHEFCVQDPEQGHSFRGHITLSGGLVNAGEKADVIDLLQLGSTRVLDAKLRGKNRVSTSAQTSARLPYLWRLSQPEQERLQKLADQRARSRDSLLREAVELLRLYYPMVRTQGS